MTRTCSTSLFSISLYPVRALMLMQACWQIGVTIWRDMDVLGWTPYFPLARQETNTSILLRR